MICDVCNDMLHRHEGRQWRGMFDLQFDHHADERSLKGSVDKHCGIAGISGANYCDSSQRIEALPSVFVVKSRLKVRSLALICLSLLGLGRKEFTALTSS